MSIDSRLEELGLTLPEAAAPVANYVPYVQSGNLVFISGQVSKIGDNAIGGRLGENLSIEQGQEAAESSDNVKERIQFEEDRFMRAPLVIGVVSSPIECPRGTPKWEQELSAGALCFNLCLAAQSMGFAAQWLTEWYAYDSKVLAAAGLAPSEKMAGYIYIGQTDSAPAERARPELLNKVTNWPG